MTQTNLTRPQGLNRLDPVLREAASELGVVEFRDESLH
ncbi:MAG TPA: alpha/beta hydrolase, partial [Mycobacterium sp.]